MSGSGLGTITLRLKCLRFLQYSFGPSLEVVVSPDLKLKKVRVRVRVRVNVRVRVMVRVMVRIRVLGLALGKRLGLERLG